MPNWCDCDLYVSGPADELSRFLEAIKTKDGEEGEYAILSNLVPTPTILRNVASPPVFIDTREEAKEKNKEYMDTPLGRDHTVRYMTKDQAEKLNRRYGAIDWYNWNISNWGSKWGDCETTLMAATNEGLSINFQSPWGPPSTGLLRVSEIYPRLTIKCNYYECGMGFQGVFTCANGEVLEDESGEYSGDRGG